MLKAFIAAFSIYSRVPVPQFKWNEDEAEYILCFFPFVGIVIAVAEWLVWMGSGFIKLPAVAEAALLCALPVLIDGGIHADGFVDTVDARSSYGSKEKKLAILKDPHIGAFGVIMLILYFMLVYAGVYCLVSMDDITGEGLLLLLTIPVLSRVLSALAAKYIPAAKKDGMLKPLSGRKKRMPQLILFAELIICLVIILCSDVFAGIALICVNFLLFIAYRRMAIKEFGGVSGDTAGWYLCMVQLLCIWTAVMYYYGVFV